MTLPRARSAFDLLNLDAVRDQEALRRVYTLPSDTAIRKQMTELTEQTQKLIGCGHWFWSPARTPRATATFRRAAGPPGSWPSRTDARWRYRTRPTTSALTPCTT
jgi:hypothetical protein